MTSRNRAFRTAMRILFASSALLLLLMAALQFLPELRTRLGLFPTGLAQQAKTERLPRQLGKRVSDTAKAEDEFPTELSGSVAGDKEDFAADLLPMPSPLPPTTAIDLESPGEVTPDDEGFPVEMPAAAAAPPGISLEVLEERLGELEARQKEQNERHLEHLLEQLSSHTQTLDAIRERLESTERGMAELKERPAISTSDDSQPNIRIESSIEDGRQRLTVECRDGSLPRLLAQLGEAAGVNVLVSPEITGTVSLHLSDVDPRKALDTVCRMHNCRLEEDGIGMAVTRETPQEEPQEQIAAKPVFTETISKLYRLKYLTGSEIRPYISAVLTPESGSVHFASIRERIGRTTYRNPPAAILVRDTAAVINEVDKLILELDQPTEFGRQPRPTSQPRQPDPSTQLQSYLPAPTSPPQLLPAGPSMPPQQLPLPPPAPAADVLDASEVIFLPPLER